RLHFITFSCYHRAPLLGTEQARHTFVRAGKSAPVVWLLRGRLCGDARACASADERTGTRHSRPVLADGEADSFTETARGDADRLRLETPAFAKNAKGRPPAKKDANLRHQTENLRSSVFGSPVQTATPISCETVASRS